MSELHYCPNCGNTRRSSAETPSCWNCDKDGMTTSVPLQTRGVTYVKEAILYAIGIAVFIGPPVYVLYRLVTYDGPLYATKEVEITTTQAYGFLPEVGGIAVIWLLFLMVAWFAAYGPRMSY